MSKTLIALLFPFLSLQLKFGDGEGGAPDAEQSPTAEQAPTPETVEEGAEEAKAETDSDNKPVDKTFTQAELDEILQKRIAKLERKHEKERIQNQTRQEVMAELAAKPQEVQGKPVSGDFANYDDYLEALADYKAEQKYQSLKQADAEKTVREREMTEAQRRQERELDLIETGNNKYDDFDEVASKAGAHLKSKNLSFSPVMVNALIEADNAADIVHHLGTNLDEAERIARLPPYAQAKEIGKLEDKLLAKPVKQVSKAPPPIAPISTGKVSASGLADELPMDEWMRRRNKQRFG